MRDFFDLILRSHTEGGRKKRYNFGGIGRGGNEKKIGLDREMNLQMANAKRKTEARDDILI